MTGTLLSHTTIPFVQNLKREEELATFYFVHHSTISTQEKNVIVSRMQGNSKHVCRREQAEFN